MLTREQILNSLERLGELLQENDLTGELLLTGGAAMSLVHNARDMTQDVDALFEPKTEIRALASQVAYENGLPEDWLNDSVKGYITTGAPTKEFTVLHALTISTVTPEYLLAMKLMSARHGTRDLEDIEFLLNKLNIQTLEDAMELLTAHFPSDRILPKSRYVLEEYFADCGGLGMT